MSSLLKLGAIVLSAGLIAFVASPVSVAQTGPFPTIVQLNANGGYLGIQMDDVTAANMSKFKLSSEKGVIVRSVMQGSPAEKAGLHTDDVILEYAGTQVWSASQFSRLVQETPPGRTADLVISREGKRVNLTAEIGKREEARPESNSRDFYRIFPDGQSDRRGFFISPTEPASKPPRLGLTLQPLSDQLAQYLGVPGKKGALVSSVLEGSPAAGKIRAGDVIIEVDGRDVRDPQELTRIVQDKNEGSLNLKIIRDKKEIAVSVTLPALPAEAGPGIKL